VSLPESRIVNTSAMFGEDLMTIDGVAVHTHGPAGEHSHTGTAFTTWIDFSQAVKQAESITKALATAGIETKSILDAKFETLASELNALDKDMLSITSGHSEVPLLASHPVYGYFARRYRINLKSVFWEPDSVPADREWLALAQLLRTHPARWMVWEGEPLPETRDRLMSMGVGSVVFDPCGNRLEDQGDFLAVMKQNTENLRAVFARGE
jgi:zinc transport system substrate-binding protein